MFLIESVIYNKGQIEEFRYVQAYGQHLSLF